MADKIKIALAGNPNSGKTTLFNALTGSNQYVGNWPGVTVEKKDGLLKGAPDVIIQDLPGIYSLSPYSLEEKVSRRFLVEENPDAILNIVDGTNIERNLYLSTQLAELGLPMVMAVNMMDVVKKNGDRIDFAKIAKALRCEVVGISALKGEGGVEAAKKAVELAGAAAQAKRPGEVPHVFTGSVEHAIAHIEESIQGLVKKSAIRWYAIKIFERDREVIQDLNLGVGVLKHIEDHIRDCEKELDDDAESIITNQRYEFIQNLMSKALTKSEIRKNKATLSDKIDRIVTNRILALPIFLLSLCVMWWLAVADGGPGTVLTDWANDGFLGDGWHLPFTTHACTVDGKYKGMEFEDAQGEFAKQDASKTAWEEAYLEKINEGKGDDDKVEEMPEEIDEAVAATIVAKDVFVEDEETGEPVAKECDCETCAAKAEAGEECEGCGCGCGEPDLWNVDYAAYKAACEWEEPDPSQFGVWVPGIGALIGGALEKLGVSETVASLVNDGAWGGVATVLGFVPVIFVVFLFLAFLEDCGYMARVAFIMDRLFRKFGLSGKSFIPMIVGKGCGVPAVMAARTIENERDHRMTVILATFIPCGAKTVIIAMFAALFFRDMWYVAPLMDVIGIAIIVLGGIALKKSRAFAGEAAPFVMELPAYHLPTVSGIWRHTWIRLKGYILKAGLIIFPACVFLWFIMNFDFRFNLVGEEGIDQSMLATMGGWIAWLLAPLGFGTWQGAAASVSAEIAKEQATATLGLVAANMDGASTAAHVTNLFASFVPACVPAASKGAVAKLIAMSFMVFNLFIPPCMVAIAVTFREMGSKAWGWLAVGFQLFVGYVLALSIYQLGLLAMGCGFGFWTVVTILVDLFCLWAVFRPAPKAR
ncbi:MAG: ferrous iron transporter B [Kiritimatiellae bacterium]|nr:ferrous iron transporter B [Kiritimatiellia bacterium]